MANELVIHYPTGATLYALLFDATGQIYNGSTFGAPLSASWTDYDIAMAEVATATGIYRASMPAVAAGAYGWVVRRQAGASPAVADIAVGSGTIRWTGTAEEAVPAAVNVTMVKGLPAPDLAGLDGLDGTTLALETTAQAILAVIGAGSGTGLYTDTITNGSTPLDGVRVQLSTDEAGEHRVYETFTNALGVFVLRPDPGTYYRWLDLAGITFEQGIEVEVL